MLTALSQWWQRPEDSMVAVSGKDVISAKQFENRVSAWVSLLEQTTGTRWAVFHHDAAECLAIICALWQLSKTACLVGDNLPDTADRLAPEVDGFVGQFAIKKTIQLASNNDVNQKVSWKKVSADHPAIEVYTSGSTGEPKVIKKTMLQLETELMALDCLMPESPSEIVAATVTHQHLYGLTFRLFRPFCYQQAFNTHRSQYPEDLIALVTQFASFSLVSSPSHLGRMSDQHDWHLIADKCVEVYCSTAPLNLQDSLNVSHILQAPVKEIYGSSETGALAWRCQQSAEPAALWQALPHVELSPAADSSLNVVFTEDARQLNLADQVTFYQAGRFELQGRIDQIVKVEGKRVSLNEMNAMLQDSEWVEQAQALTLEGHRCEMVVAIILSDAGNDAMQQLGRKQLIATLKKQLSQHFEAIVIPRRWRFVSAFPVNSQGKLPRQNLLKLFEKEQIKWPDILNVEKSVEQVTLTCLLPKQLIYFDGHFDQQPILPGVVQVHWAEFYGRQFFQVQGKFSQIEALKFQLLLLPEQLVSIRLSYDADKQKLLFSYLSETGTHSSGRICYA